MNRSYDLIASPITDGMLYMIEMCHFHNRRWDVILIIINLP